VRAAGPARSRRPLELGGHRLDGGAPRCILGELVAREQPSDLAALADRRQPRGGLGGVKHDLAITRGRKQVDQL
jgi:hypothetical protein